MQNSLFIELERQSGSNGQGNGGGSGIIKGHGKEPAEKI